MTNEARQVAQRVEEVPEVPAKEAVDQNLTCRYKKNDEDVTPEDEKVKNELVNAQSKIFGG